MKPRHIISNALFLILFILVLIPSDDEVVFGGVFLGVLAATELAFLYFQIFKKSVAACDIAGVVYIVLLLWELATSKFIWVDRVMFPPPENVFDIFRKHGDRLFSDLLASLARLGVGFVSAVVAAVLLGILIGWFKPIKETVFPIIKIIAPIPSLVYVSYLIGVMPSFRVAAIAVIFLGVFFPNIIGIISAVSGIDKQITDSAKSLNVGKLTMLYRVLLPYIVPAILNDLAIGVTFAFMTLTIAETLGATTGLGYFVKRFISYGDFTSVMAAIILMAATVTVLNLLLTLLKKKTVNWVK